MKKAILRIAATTLCFLCFFVGCSQDPAETDVQSEFCRVLCRKDAGIVVWIENIGNIYVKNVDAALEIEPLDTVVMEFSQDDLKPDNKPFTDVFGEDQNYLYVLEKPKSIRHTNENEPTFG